MAEEKDSKNKNLSTKLAFGVLCLVGIMTLLLGVMQIGQNIKLGTYYADSLQTDTTLDFNSVFDNTQLTEAELKNSDLDGDGLSDYDEIYVYNTSPYLTDSDSDGYSDKQEIDDGFDPNCPKGQDCRTSSSSGDSQTDDNVLPATGEEATSTGNGLSAEARDLIKNLTPAEVRQLLQENEELTDEQKAQLQQIDDETLMQIFQETLNSAN